jgi:PAS domain S-box-containing protein
MGVFNPRVGKYNWLVVNSVPLIEPGEDTPSGVYTTFEDITEQKETETRLAHLNRVLLTIRSVNRLITEASDRDSLMDRIAASLVQERGYSQVWILTQGPEGRPLRLSSAGMDVCEEEFRTRIESGWLPLCVNEARNSPEVVQFRGDSPECEVCPVKGRGNDRLVSGLRAEGVLYGVISAVLPAGLSTDPEEKEIFSEVAHDIGFALHHLVVWEREQAAVVALAQSEEKYRELVENIPEVIFTMDVSGNFTYISPAIMGILGYSSEEVTGHHYAEVTLPEELQKMDKAFREGLAGRTARIEFRAIDNEQKIHIVSAVINPVFEDGMTTITGLSGIVADITEQKKAEEARELENTRVRVLLELHTLAEAPEEDIRNSALHGALVVTRSSLGFLGLVSEDESRLIIHAWSKETMANCNVPNTPLHFSVTTGGLWADSIREKRTVIVNDYAREKGKKGYPEGHIAITRFMVVPVFEGGRVRAVVAVANREEPYFEESVAAITTLGNAFWELVRRRRAEQDLRTRQHELVEAQSLAHVGSLEYNIHEDTLIWSEEISRIVGITPDEIPKSPAGFIRYIAPEDQDRVREAMEEVISYGGEHDMEHGVIRPDGTKRTVHFRIRAIPDDQGRPMRVIGTSQDITEQKRDEERIASAVAQIARNLEQMAILNDSIRNPLSVIVGLADMAGGETNKKILRAAREIDDIITELDRGWIKSDKVRRFLQVHHHLYPEEREEEAEGREEGGEQ